MKDPISRFKELRDINGILKLSYDTLFVKYILENKKGDDKLWEWESTDQESLILSKNGGYPLPGSVYTFIYPPQLGINELPKNKSYIDVVPMVFCTGIRDGMLSGVNFNLLPDIERLSFLSTYYNSYKSFFGDLEKKTQNDELVLNKKFITIASSVLGQMLLKAFIQKSGSNFNYAFRKYNLRNIANIRMIEYCEWDYIPFYSPKNAIKGINFNDIYKSYWKSR